MTATLELRNLVVTYATERGDARAVDGVSLAIEPAQNVGLIGESGSGKTTLLRAIVGVFPANARIVSGEIHFKGRDVLRLSAHERRDLRWKEIATIPQASMESLDPVQRVGRQLVEILTVRGRYGRRTARSRAVELFELVGLRSEHLRRYPHEFSGGMKQRAIIAMALALRPSLLIADEPVTALDVLVQDQVLAVFKRLQEELDLTVLLITHDISVVAQVCDSVAVMYAGRIVEQAPAEAFFASPYHPYSLGLQKAFPNVLRADELLTSIEGYPPDLVAPPPACRFAPRCPFALARCEQVDPVLESVARDHAAACLRKHEMDDLRPLANDPATWLGAAAAAEPVLVEHSTAKDERVLDSAELPSLP